MSAAIPGSGPAVHSIACPNLRGGSAMPFQITWEPRPNTLGLDDRVAVLANGANRLEVWPALGFNAFRWQVVGQELLYRNPQFFSERKPTRSGFPILFPFPNRI